MWLCPQAALGRKWSSEVEEPKIYRKGEDAKTRLGMLKIAHVTVGTISSLEIFTHLWFVARWSLGW